MIIYTKDQMKVNATKCTSRPKFNYHFGRTWQWGTVFIDGKDYRYTYDNTWGSYWYFEYNNQWYKVHIWDKTGYEPHYKMQFFTISKGESK